MVNFTDPASSLPPAGPALIADLSLMSLGYRLTGFMWIAPLCLLWYDILITLDVEVKYFWNRARGFASWLFFINRYWPAANLTFHNIILSWKGVSPKVCTFWFQYTAYSAGIEHFVVGAILIIRVYAIYNSNKKLLVGLIALYGVCMTAETILIGLVTHRFHSFETLRATFAGCAPVGVPLWSWVYWIPSVLFESTMFLLVLWKTIQEARGSLAKPSRLMIVLLTDSVVYFGGVTSVTLLNFVAWYLQPLALYGMFVGWHIGLQSILGCRLLLNIRQAAAVILGNGSHNDDETVKLTSYHRFHVQTMSSIASSNV